MRYGPLIEGLELLDREALVLALAAGDIASRARLPHGGTVQLWPQAWRGDAQIRWEISQLSVPLEVLEMAEIDPEGAARLAATLPRPGAKWPPPALLARLKIPAPVYVWVVAEIDLEAVERLAAIRQAHAAVTTEPIPLRGRGRWAPIDDDTTLAKIHELILAGHARTPHDAAWQLLRADMVQPRGSGIDDSVVKRLIEKYHEKYPTY
jgi:hypothetical protein